MESQGAATKCQEIEGDLAFLILQYSAFDLRPCDICPTEVIGLNRAFDKKQKQVSLLARYL